MLVRILPGARARIFEIWEYTEKSWGEDQADAYVRELVDAINGLPKNRRHWKRVGDKSRAEVFCIRYRHHYIFFRELSRAMIGVISILHENMNIPSRLKEDAAIDEDD